MALRARPAIVARRGDERRPTQCNGRLHSCQLGADSRQVPRRARLDSRGCVASDASESGVRDRPPGRELGSQMNESSSSSSSSSNPNGNCNSNCDCNFIFRLLSSVLMRLGRNASPPVELGSHVPFGRLAMCGRGANNNRHSQTQCSRHHSS